MDIVMNRDVDISVIVKKRVSSTLTSLHPNNSFVLLPCLVRLSHF